MIYDFDTEIDRRGTHCNKWEFMPDADHMNSVQTDAFMGEDRILPMWVADMDFSTPPAVVEALIGRARHGIFGYTGRTREFDEAVVGWMKRRHGWHIDPQWISNTPGVVSALFMSVRSFTDVGDGVLIQPPVYHPFYNAIERSQRRVVLNPLKHEDGRYCMDFTDLEQKTRDPSVKLAFLCHPHNPVGRVWTKDELTRFGEICMKNNVLVISDEIHGDLIFPGIKYTAYATLGEDFAQNSVVCTAPSKTFNLAGLKTSNIIIKDEALRNSFERTLEKNAVYGLNPFGVAALIAAYRHCDEWLEQLMQYVADNLSFMEQFISRHLPSLKVIRPEGTYLVWLDCRGLGLSADELHQLFVDDARVLCDDGGLFGPEGAGFQRINIACPRSILREALNRLKNAVSALAVDAAAG
jgi:cystathionine beta-lyase